MSPRLLAVKEDALLWKVKMIEVDPVAGWIKKGGTAGNFLVPKGRDFLFSLILHLTDYG